MLKFYVYAYIRSCDDDIGPAGSPYYIGKGTGYRAFNKNHKVPLPDNQSLIVFIESSLSHIGALAIERRLIRWYGRVDLGTGILLNQSGGGENKPLEYIPMIKEVKGVKGLPPIKMQKRSYVPIEIPYKKYKRREAIRERLMK